ncbi:MAG TPA: D-alanyl-D-alanine carboxypeptidase/D-alanyl-D-alanine-endopeptidase [Candidatus Kapabacteria bacterium]|nr:D-alanyl-D-alanine carboxypeptidase/D-alanyl-D-alanine-endopeptidase [Candidatus Kapabacteria bacterium]
MPIRPLRILRGAAFLIAILIFHQAAHAQPITAPAREQSPAEVRALADLERDLAKTLGDEKFSNAEIGIEIRSLKTGDKLFSLDADKNLLPASNLKLVTTSAALHLLGPDFHYSTQIVTNGKIVKQTLKGDLIIRGSGDPTLGSPSMFPGKAPTAIFDDWADSLEALGIEKIEGSIVADASYFTSDLYPLGWAVEDLPYYYATQSAGLVFADDAVSVTVSPGIRGGAKPVYEITPESEYFQMNDLAVTRDAPMKHSDTIAVSSNTISVTRDAGGNTISIQGSIDKNSPAVNEQLSVDDPPLYAATVLRGVLRAHGIVVTGAAITAADLDERINYNSTRLLIEHSSPPLSEIVKVINKKSHNFFSEQLLRTLGKETLGKGDWRTGVQAEKKYLSFATIEPDRIALYDGSGLSRMDLVSASDLVNVLRYATFDQKTFPIFDSSLPVMGIDGTLSERLKDSRASGNVHAKTGSLTGARSLSGYLRTKDDEPLVFSIIINNYTTPGSDVGNLLDLIILRLVNFSRNPTSNDR